MQVDPQCAWPNISAVRKTFPKEVWIGWVSSAVEAYNMAIYSFMAPLLAPLLFQQATAWGAVFFSYSLVFIGSCLLYPAGAIYYGFKGDQFGRQKICMFSTLGLAIATGLMGVLPIHLLKDGWVYFLVLIGAQHFFSGGEYHGSIVFSLEHAEQKRQQSGLMSALCCLFAVCGLVAANGLATISIEMQNEWVSRICFLVGAVGGLVSYLLKNHCRETPAFCALKQEVLAKEKWPVFVRREWQKIAVTVLVVAFYLVSYSYIFIFLPSINLEANIQEFSTFKSLMAYGVCLVLSGLIADKIGIQNTMMAGMSLFSITIIPLTHLCDSLLVLQMALTFCACLVIGPVHSWMLQQFGTSQRCRGIFISSAVATSVFGGSAVPICLMIFENTHSLVMCSCYPLSIALGAMGCLICVAQPKKALEVSL